MTLEEDWEDADGGSWAALVGELATELVPGHPLYGRSYSIVARRWAQDDILLAVDDHPGCASVHLTWKQAPEVLPYPRTEWHESVAAAKDSFDDSKPRLVGDALVDEVGQHWEFDADIGWRTDLAELIAEVSPLRIVSARHPDLDLSRGDLDQLGNDVAGGVYRSKSGVIVYVPK